VLRFEQSAFGKITITEKLVDQMRQGEREVEEARKCVRVRKKESNQGRKRVMRCIIMRSGQEN
jgi:hypothetical protein